MRRTAVIAALLVALACSKSPTEPSPLKQYGRLFGVVTIGPNCPVETPDNPCPTPPAAYSQRKVLILSADRSRQLATVDIDSRGLYVIDLVPGTYVIDLKKVGIDSSPDVPATVTILANLSTQKDIRIDTGLR